jgi:5-methylcytosine-specific restriction endonuclease McrA
VRYAQFSQGTQGPTLRLPKQPTDPGYRREYWRGRSNRDRHIRRHPLCQRCERAFAVEVHHLKPISQGGTNDPGNLQSVCRQCHREAHGKECPE